jgi:hypothetical protein
MDVLELIDKLDELVRNAKHVPLSREVRVDKEKLDDLLNEMRATIPEEIKEARWIVKERAEMLAAAEREAERILGEAQERQAELVAEHHLTGEAELAAEGIIDDARAPRSASFASAPRTTPTRSSAPSSSTSPSSSPPSSAAANASGARTNRLISGNTETIGRGPGQGCPQSPTGQARRAALR